MTSERERDEVDEATRRDLRELFAAPPAAPLARRPAADPLPVLMVDPEWEPPRDSHRRRRWVLGGVVGLATAGAIVGARALLSDSATSEPLTLQPGPSVLLADSAPALMPAPAPTESAPPPRRPPVESAPPAARPALAPSTAVAAPVPTTSAVRRRSSQGRLFINSTPWGELYLDDVRVGNTPRPDVAVTAGVHRLRIVRDGFHPFELSISVTPGEVVRLTDIVLKELVP